VDHVPAGDRWIHEMKFDGYRVLLAVSTGQARAYTRSGLDWSDKFAPIVNAAKEMKVGSALIDGEAVVLDAQGRSDFQALQQTLKGGKANLTFFAFDLLGAGWRGSDDATSDRAQAPLGGHRQPRQHRHHPLLLSTSLAAARRLLAKFCGLGLEGVISKLADALCRIARRRLAQDEMPSAAGVRGRRLDRVRQGARVPLAHPGLNEGGVLRYAGKVGTGFNEREMTRVSKAHEAAGAPGAGGDRSCRKVKAAHWLEPKLVAEVAYAEMTDDGELRHASYIGLREDKKPEAVVPEIAKPVAAAIAATAATIAISSADRVLFPESGITKGQLAAYYQQIADVMLPWCAERPLTIIRCPQGRAKKCFFQKARRRRLRR
jgi:bifunctional non-homologous end joining protein LigD